MDTVDKDNRASEGDLIWFHVPGEIKKRLGLVIYQVAGTGLKDKTHYIIWSSIGWWVRAENTIIPT